MPQMPISVHPNHSRHPRRFLRGWSVLLAAALAACSHDGWLALPSVRDLCLPGRIDGTTPSWWLENEPVAISIGCQSGTSHPTLRVESLPPGSSFDPNSGLFSWVPDLGQAGIYHLVVHAGDERGSVRIDITDAWGVAGNQPIADPINYTHEMGVPVLFLNDAPTQNVYAPAQVIFGGRIWPIDAKLRGAASLGYPKKNYTLRFFAGDRFDAPEEDFEDRKKIVLISTFDDNSQVRQRLAYETWNSLHPDHVHIEGFHVVVYRNEVYHGLYVLADHVDRHLYEAHGLDEEGNVYKAINHDANFRLVRANGDPKATLHDGYEKKDGLPLQGDPNAFDDLDDLVNFIATTTDTQFLGEVESRIRVAEYLDWWSFVVFTLAEDSAGKNSYHYHDPNGGLFRFAPWDFNHSFGQDWRTRRVASTKNRDYRGNNLLFARFMDNEPYASELTDGMARHLQSAFHPDIMLARIDAWLEQIDSAALRDQEKWNAAYQSYGGWNTRTDFLDHEGEVDYLRQWIVSRWNHLGGIYR